VKQIVGGSLSEHADNLKTNFVSERPAAWYAALYARDGLQGGHVVMLGAGNEEAARSALAAYPGGLQIGGGINGDNARSWLDAGASHVILTSWVFTNGRINWDRLEQLVKSIGRDRLVLDLSCRKKGEDYFIVTDRWRKFTEVQLKDDSLKQLSRYASEFLVHSVDVEGLCQGIDMELVMTLSAHSPVPTTYAGGAKSMDDLETVTREGQGRMHLTIGSALDIFGGTGVRYADALAFNREVAS